MSTLEIIGKTGRFRVLCMDEPFACVEDEGCKTFVVGCHRLLVRMDDGFVEPCVTAEHRKHKGLMKDDLCFEDKDYVDTRSARCNLLRVLRLTEDGKRAIVKNERSPAVLTFDVTSLVRVDKPTPEASARDWANIAFTDAK